jgi:F-type H+-transporting ATPase subunit delta
MAVKRKELSEAILALAAKKSDQKKLARSIATYLVDNRRTKELDMLLRDLEELHFRQDGVLEVSATTARPLSDAAKKEIAKLFDAKNVQIYEQIEPELLGGVRVRALDQSADYSVQARLRRLRRGN